MNKDTKPSTPEEMGSIAQLRKVDYVESGLPRWLLVAAFIAMLVQAAEWWSQIGRAHV